MKNSVDVLMITCLGTCLFLMTGCSEESETVSSFPDMSPLPRDTTDERPLPVETAAPERPQASEEGPWPVASAEDTNHDFGKMSVGTELSHVFRIGNTGDADLVLQPGKPTCKCTAFGVRPLTVKPGEFAEVNITWKGKFKDLKFQHGGPIYTNDPKRTEIRYTVSGIVDANLDVLPEETWSVGEVTESQPGEMFGIIMSRVHDSFAITELKCDSPFVKTVVEPASEKELESHSAACAFKVRVTVDSSMPPGVLEEDLVMAVDCEKGPVTVTVSAHKTGPIRILPLPGVLWINSSNSLRLGQFSSKKGRSAELMLLVEEPEGQAALEFTSVESTPSFLKTELERLGQVGSSRARYKMKVIIPPGIPRSERPQDDPGVIDIKTNHPSGQDLKIKVTYKSLF